MVINFVSYSAWYIEQKEKAMANLLESMLKGQGGGEYKNMAKEKYLMLSERLFLMNNKDIMKNCLKILIKVTENIIKSNGEDPKFLCYSMFYILQSIKTIRI